MKSLVPNTVIDGFKLGEMRHKGGMALIYDVAYADGRAAPFPMVMKVPRMTAGDGAETIVSFEVEHQMMQALDGPARIPSPDRAAPTNRPPPPGAARAGRPAPASSGARPRS